MGKNKISIDINNVSKQIYEGIEKLIENAKKQVSVYLNTEINTLYWSFGNYIQSKLKYEVYSEYGKQILATLSQTLF